MSLLGGDSPGVEWEESLDPAQQLLRNRLIGNLLPMQGWEMPDFMAGPTGLQQAGFDYASQLQQQGLPSWMTGATRQLATGQPSYTYDPAASEAFYNEALYAPAMRDFQRDVLPALAEQYAGAGLSRSGDLQSALSRAGADFATNLAAQRAGLVRQDVTDARQAAESAMGRMPAGLQLAGREMAMPINLGLQAGGVQRDIQNQLGMQGLQQAIAGEWWGNPALSAFLPTALTPTRMPVMSQGQNEAGSVLGGALSGGATGALFGPWGAAIGAGLGGLGGGLLG